MASSQCRLMEAHDKRNLIEISTLIDLTDKPIGLTRNEIGWSKVRANASNCICCCCNNSITLVSRDDSYILDHIPLDNIQFAQTNPSLQYLALSNHSKIAIIDLVDNTIKCNCHNNNNSAQNGNTATTTPANSKQPNLSSNVTKIVNLAAHGLTMNDVIFWRWIDDSVLAILSYEALYTCSMNQQHINHHAYTALSNRSRYLMMEKVFETHQCLSAFCQVTDIHRDLTGNLYAISSLCSTGHNLLNQQTTATTTTGNNNIKTSFQQQHLDTLAPPLHPWQANGGKLLRPAFGSVPSRLSQLANNEHSFDSLKSEHLMFDRHHNRLNKSQQQRSSPSSSSNLSAADEICGLVQIYCKLRNRSQLIQAHAITFTSPLYHHPHHTQDLSQQQQSTSYSGYNRCEANNNGACHSQTQQQASSMATILVAANKIGAQMRVHFVEMTTFDQFPPSGYQSASPTTKFNRLENIDFPTSIVCSHVHSPSNQNYLHVALITTKHGQLFVCSVAHSTILFNVTITNDIISSTVLESSTQGLMVICRNGQVLLVNLILAKLMKLLDESKTLRHISSSHNILSSIESNNNSNGNNIGIGDENNNNDKNSIGILNNDDGDVEKKRGSSASTNYSSSSSSTSSSASSNNNSQLSASLDTGLEVLSSTKL